MITHEGYNESHFQLLKAKKRRRNCYRIDKDQMKIEITRGYSEIYDILTHLTFLFWEAHKIMKSVVKSSDNVTSDW